MHLEVGADNVAARSLYTKLGFAKVGERPGYYAGDVKAMVMRLVWRI
jgi:ribosomal-protein-alanine N-acetyltransferase